MRGVYAGAMLKSLLVLALGLALGLLASWMWKMSTGGAPAVLAGPEFVLRADLARVLILSHPT